ncbi:MAG: 16S rRNA (cytidine(1402)-2'-O)-methyltransferase [Deinococcus-Thermus bacterium]|jgi:16S rRNA (cytidine1402-2'-O)-methyltransferase|nr:16S rRNA (cytidine(1402)-2'-O)-methyltransferase [Deinococcota bacterium]
MTEAEAEPGTAGGPPEPGLHLVATPIGRARDITLHALDVLGGADILVAEDTRTLRKLLEIHGIALGGRPLLSYHDHNGAAQRPRLLAMLADGRSVAYCSDAGTPLVADPGYRLAREAAAAGLPVHAAPGPSAALAALGVAGLPSDRFLFAGFPPPQQGPRARWLSEIVSIPATLVVFESARRVGALLSEIAAAGHGAREAAICRELTKRHEEVRRGSVRELARALDGAAPPKGEIVVVVGPPVPVAPDEAQIADALRAEPEGKPLKQAAADVAARLGARKRDVYQLGLRLKSEDD